MNNLRILGRPIGESHQKSYSFTSETPIHLAVTASGNDVTVTTHDGLDVFVELSWYGVNTDWIGDTVDVKFDSETSTLVIDTEANEHVPPADFAPKGPAFGFIRTSHKDKRGGAFMFATNVDIAITLPRASSVESVTRSGDLAMSGQFSALTARSVSGDIQCVTPEASPLMHSAHVATTSGDIALRAKVGAVVATSTSGDIVIQRAENASISTSSGDIEVGVVRGEMPGTIECKSKSGDVVVRVTEGLSVSLDASTRSGEIANAIPLDEDSVGENGDFATDCAISIQTSSGDVRIKKSVL